VEHVVISVTVVKGKPGCSGTCGDFSHSGELSAV